MAWTIIISLLLIHLHALSCEITDSQKLTLNSLDDKDSSRPYKVTANHIKNDLDEFLEDPISSINIDYLNNAVILQFRRSIPFDDNEVEAKRRSAVDKNFMRFGRTDRSLMRFGKRQPENIVTNENPLMNSDNDDRDRELRSQRGNNENDNTRSSRSDNFMRFGRLDKGFMRFGRSSDSNQQEQQQQQQQPNRNLMRFGRSNSMMRFGRSDSRLRFGKRDGSLMRFGRSDNDINRAERGDSFMRFGRIPIQNQFSDHFDKIDFLDQFDGDGDRKAIIEKKDRNLMRFGRTDNNFMRFGKLDKNFMRFGKRNNEMEGHQDALEEISPHDLESIFRISVESPVDTTERNLRQNEVSESGRSLYAENH